MVSVRLRRALRTAALGLGLLVALVAALAVAAPLVVRGPLFARVVERLLPPMAGSLALEGGSVGVSTVFAFLLERSFPVRLEGVLVRDPEGVEVLWSEEATAQVRIARDPWRISISDLRPGQARWRFASMTTRKGIGFLSAFAPPGRAPPPPPRPRPVTPTEPRPTRPPPPPERPPIIAIESAHLDGLDVAFDFPAWGLVLLDIQAPRAQLAVRPGSVTPVTFDVWSISARAGGSLRVLGGPQRLVVPFDRARLPRVGTPASTPGELLVLVEAAMTGASKLSGRAAFPGLMRVGPKGMHIEAQWDDAAEALGAVALSRGLDQLEVSGAGAKVSLDLRSSFGRPPHTAAQARVEGVNLAYRGYRILDLGLAVEASGPPPRFTLDRMSFRAPGGGRVQAKGALVGTADARLSLEFDRLVTAGLLPPSLVPLLGGTLDGAVRARAQLEDRRAAITSADLILDRTRRGPLPHRLRLVTAGAAGQAATANGAHSQPPGRAKTAPEANGHGNGDSEALTVVLRDLRYAGGVLRLGASAAAPAGGHLGVRGTLALRDPVTDVPLAPPRLDVEVAAGGLDLRRTVPEVGLGGVLGFQARARGPLDDLTVRARFPPGSRVRVADQPYGLPRQASLTIRGDELVLPWVRVSAPGGGSLRARGRVVLDRDLDLELDVNDHRLARLPGLARVDVPVGGLLNGALRVKGSPRQPTLAGRVGLQDVRLAGVALGDAHVRLSPAGRGQVAMAGAIFGAQMSGQLRLGSGGPAIHAALDAQGLRLDPIIARFGLLPEPRATVTGRLTVDAGPARPAQLAADLERFRVAYACGPVDQPIQANPDCVNLESVGPVRLVVKAGPDLTFQPIRMRSDRSDFVFAGHLREEDVHLSLDGTVNAHLFGPLLDRLPVDVSGAVRTNVRIVGDPLNPVLAGELAVAEPLVVRADRVPVPVEIASGSVTVDHSRWRSEGLTLVAADGLGRLVVSGEADFDLLTGRVGDMRLGSKGEVDARLIARALPGILAEARGTLDVQARVEGTPGDSGFPRLGGEIAPREVRLLMRGFPQPITIEGGRVYASGSTIFAEGVTAALAPSGTIVLGPAGAPARLDVLSLQPLRLGRVFATVVADNVGVQMPWLVIGDGRARARLEGHVTNGPLHLTGNVYVGQGTYWRSKQPETRVTPRRVERPPTARRPREREIPIAPLTLDLRVATDGRRFSIDPGWLPDIRWDLDARIGGTVAKPRVTWQADPHGLYSRLVLFLARLFT